MKLLRIRLAVMFLAMLKTAEFAQPVFNESVIWPNDTKDGVAEHFVYGLALSAKNTVLAFAEARLAVGDTTPHHIVLKRSLDLGITWQPSQIVVKSTEGACYANPTPIVDTSTGTIFLFYARNYGNRKSDLMLITSSDDGLSWAKPQTLTQLFDTDSLKRPFHLPGPGHGIRLRSGRLLLQVWHRFPVDLPADKRYYGASVIYSDDNGKTWQAGGYIPKKDSLLVNESRLVEMPDGAILMNSRNAATTHHAERVVSISGNKGLTWTNPIAGTMPASAPVDEGMVMAKINHQSTLLISYPAGPGRNNLKVATSSDGGKTWPISKLIFKGAATYSDILILPDSTALVLYGRGNPKTVAVAKFNMQWINE